MKNLRDLGTNPFPYIIPVIHRPLPEELVKGEPFVLANLLKSISGSYSQVGYAHEPQAEIAEGALVVAEEARCKAEAEVARLEVERGFQMACSTPSTHFHQSSSQTLDAPLSQ